MAENNSIASMSVDIYADQKPFIMSLMKGLKEGQEILDDKDLTVGLDINDKKLLEDVKKSMKKLEEIINKSTQNINGTSIDLGWSKEIDDLKKHLNELDSKTGQFSDTIASVTQTVEKLSNEIGQLDGKSFNKVSNDIGKADKAIDNLKNNIVNTKEALDVATKKLSEMSTLGKNITNKDAWNAQITSVRNLGNELNTALGVYKGFVGVDIEPLDDSYMKSVARATNLYKQVTKQAKEDVVPTNKDTSNDNLSNKKQSLQELVDGFKKGVETANILEKKQKSLLELNEVINKELSNKDASVKWADIQESGNKLIELKKKLSEFNETDIYSDNATELRKEVVALEQRLINSVDKYSKNHKKSYEDLNLVDNYGGEKLRQESVNNLKNIQIELSKVDKEILKNHASLKESDRQITQANLEKETTSTESTIAVKKLIEADQELVKVENNTSTEHAVKEQKDLQDELIQTTKLIHDQISWIKMLKRPLDKVPTKTSKTKASENISYLGNMAITANSSGTLKKDIGYKGVDYGEEQFRSDFVNAFKSAELSEVASSKLDKFRSFYEYFLDSFEQDNKKLKKELEFRENSLREGQERLIEIQSLLSNPTQQDTNTKPVVEEKVLTQAISETNEERKEAIQLENQIDVVKNDNLSPTPSENVMPNSRLNQENESITESVNDLRFAFDEKTKAITNEQLTMDEAAKKEVISINTIIEKVIELKGHLENVSGMDVNIGLNGGNTDGAVSSGGGNINNSPTPNSLPSVTNIGQQITLYKDWEKSASSARDAIHRFMGDLSGYDVTETIKKDADGFRTFYTVTGKAGEVIATFKAELDEFGELDVTQTTAKISTDFTDTEKAVKATEKATEDYIQTFNRLMNNKDVTDRNKAYRDEQNEIVALKKDREDYENWWENQLQQRTTKSRLAEEQESKNADKRTQKDADNYVKWWTDALNKRVLVEKQTEASLSPANQKRYNNLMNTTTISNANAVIEADVGSTNKIDEYGVAVNTVRDKFIQLKDAMDKLQNASGDEFDKAASDVAVYKKELQDLQKDAMSTKYNVSNDGGLYAGTVLDDVNLGKNAGNVSNRLKGLAAALGEGSVETTKFNANTNTLKATLHTTEGILQDITLSYDKTTGAVRKAYGAEKEYISFVDKWKKGFQLKIGQVLQYIGAIGLVSKAIQTFKNGVVIIKEIDDALTELKKTAEGTELQFKNFVHTAGQISTEIGSTSSAIISSAADWSRLGYTLEEVAILAKNTAIYMNVSEIDNIGTATEYLTSTMKAYGIEVSNSISLVDKFNEIGNNYAISSGGIGEALKRSAASLVEAGNSLDQSLGMITAANIITQDPESVGNAIKVLSLRIRGAKTELESMGEETDTLAISTSKLQEKIKAITGIDIMIDDSTFKSTYDILLEISKVWETLDDVSQADMLETMAGKTRSSVVAGLIQNMDTAEKVVGTSSNSSGSALEENAKKMDSISGKITLLKAEFEELWSNSISTGLIEWFIDLGAKIVDTADKLGGLGTAFGVLMSMVVFKNIGNIANSFSSITSKFQDLSNVMATLNSGKLASAFGDAPKIRQIAEATKGLNSELLTQQLAQKGLTAENIRQVLKKQQLGKAEIEAALASSFTTKANYAQSISWNAVSASIGTAISNLKIFLFHTPVGWAILAAGAIFTAVKAFDYFNESQKESIAIANELSEAYKSSTTTIKGSIATLEGLRSEFDTLSQGVDENGKNIGLSAEQYDRYKEIIQQIIGISPSLIKGYDAEGNALVNNNGLLQDAIDLQNILNEEKKQEYLSKGSAILKGANAEVSQVKKSLNSADINSKLVGSSSDYGSLWKIYEELGIDSIKLAGDNVAEYRKLVDFKDLLIEKAKTEFNLSDKQQQAIRDQINLIDTEMDKVDAANQKVQTYLSFWASADPSNDWYNDIDSGYLDELQIKLNDISAYNPTMSINDMQNATEELGEEFLKIQDQIPTAAIEDLKKNLAEGVITEEEFNSGLSEQINIINSLADSIILNNPALASLAELIRLIAQGYTDFINQDNKISVVIPKVEPFVTEEESKALEDYNTKMNAIKTTYEKLNTAKLNAEKLNDEKLNVIDVSTISELMEEFSTYDWTAYLNESKDLKTVLNELANDSFNSVLNKLGEVGKSESFRRLLSDSSNYTDKVKELQAEVDNTVGTLEMFNSALKDVKDNQSMSQESIREIIKLYPQLADNVKQTSNGYIIESKALITLRDQIYNTKSAMIDAQISQTESLIENTKLRIKAYEEEIKSLHNLITMAALMDTDGKTINAVGNQQVEVAIIGNALSNSYEAISGLESQLDSLKGQKLQLDLFSKPSKDKGSKQIFDWLSIRIDKLKEKAQAAIDSIVKYTSYKTKNAKIDIAVQTKVDQTKSLKSIQDAYNTAAEKIKLPDTYKDLVNNGGMTVETIKDEKLAKKIEEYTKWKDAATEVGKSIIVINQEIKELKSQKLDNIKSYFDNRSSLLDSKSSKKQAQLDLKKSQGKTVKESDYNSLITIQNDKKAYLQTEYDALKTEFDNLVANTKGFKYSDDWFKYKEILIGVETELIDCDEAVIGFGESIEELRWKSFEDAITKINNVKSEIGDLQGLLSGDNLDKNGKLTNTGLTNLGLNFQGITQSKQAIADYQLAIDSLDKTQADYNEKLAEYQSLQRQEAQNIKSYKDAIIDFKKNALEAETEAMRESVNVKKEALQAEKDLHDYKKSIEDEGKNIAILQKKIAALSLSSDRKDIALRLSLEQDLAEAQKELQETQYDENMEQQQSALDDELESYEKTQDEKLKNLENSTDEQEKVIATYLSEVTKNYDTVYKGINTLADTYGIALSTSLTSPWVSAKSSAQLYYDYVNEMKANATIDTSNVTKNTTVTKKLLESVLGTTVGQDNSADAKAQGLSKLNQYLMGKGYQTATKSDMVELANILGISGVSSSNITSEQKNAILEALKKIKGFKSGTSKILKDQLAWTQEDGGELIIKPSSNSILTPLSKGDGVINADFTKNLMEWGKINPINIGTNSKIPDFSAFVNRSSNNITVHYDTLLNVEGNVDKSLDVDSMIKTALNQNNATILKVLKQKGI